RSGPAPRAACRWASPSSAASSWARSSRSSSSRRCTPTSRARGRWTTRRRPRPHPAPTPPASCPRWSRSAPCPWAATAPRKARPRRSRTRRAAMRNGLAALMVAVVGVLGSGAARAQEPARVPALRVDSLPPLPDSLRLYGDTLAVRFALPDAAPPPGARRLSLEEAVRLALAQNPDLRIGLLEAE